MAAQPPVSQYCSHPAEDHNVMSSLSVWHPGLHNTSQGHGSIATTLRSSGLYLGILPIPTGSTTYVGILALATSIFLMATYMSQHRA